MTKNIKFSVMFWGLLFLVLSCSDAFAQDVNDVVDNIQKSSVSLSGFLSGISYLTGVLFAVLAIMKTIDHVTNPSQTPISKPVIRFLIGGALFALPTIMGAAYNTISGGGANSLNYDPADLGGVFTVIQAYATAHAGVTVGGDFNSILMNFLNSISDVPGLVSITSYLLGILLTISGLLKARDHVDDPERTTIREPLIRLLIAGALFAIPTVFDAMYNTIADGGTIGVFFTNVLLSFASSSEDPTLNPLLICPVRGMLPITPKLGDVICSAEMSAVGLPVFLFMISYIIGLFFGIWGLMKIRDHVLSPMQTGLSEGVTRLLAGGGFFALPFVAEIMTGSITPATLAVFQVGPTNTTFNESLGACTGTNSLDQAFGCLMQDILIPSHTMINFFSTAAGLIFIMIGISRVIKSAQDGPKGPGGRGTIATFVTGGILISANAILRAVSASLFNNQVTSTYASLTYTGTMSAAETQATYNLISAVLKFMIIIGIISFVRGIFIIRDVAEGNQQASTMAALTHIIGGALAVNLGPLLNAVQNTLGVTAFGVAFG